MTVATKRNVSNPKTLNEGGFLGTLNQDSVVENEEKPVEKLTVEAKKFPEQCTIVSVQFQGPTDVLNIRQIERLASSQATIVLATGGVMISHPDVPYWDFVPTENIRRIRWSA